jgi:two-component system, response regulator YesN
MITLAIADRDHDECVGIKWLSQKYSISFSDVYFASSVDSLLTTIETKIPSILCLEIDMLPKEQLSTIKKLILRYDIKTIVMTAEATFERALQALELRALDFWVKPLSPDKIMSSLRALYSESSKRQKGEKTEERSHLTQPLIHFEDILQEVEGTSFVQHITLIQPMHTEVFSTLMPFLKEYEFSSKVSVWPLNNEVAVIYECPEDKSIHQYEEANRLLRDWNELYKEPLSIVVYSSNDSSISLHKKYIAARNAMEMKFFKGTRNIILVEKEIKWESIDPFLTSSEQRQWITMLESGDKSGIKHWMYEQFLHLREPHPEPGLLRIRLTSILAQVRRYMKKFYLDTEPFETSYQRIFQTILYETVLYRIVQDLMLFIFDTIDSSVLQQQNATVDVVEQSIQYIQTHYKNPDLSLDEVANHVERNASYLSHLLKTKQGQTFSSLLNQLRLMEAERLLLHSRLSIQEICFETGFKNANYFSRIFKQKNGVSPREYRAKNNT